MWQRYGLSWRLVRSSWRVLRQNTDLLFFPLLTVIGAAILLGSFGWAMLLWLDYDIQRVVDAPKWAHTLLTYTWFVISYAIGSYANTALVAAVMNMLRDEELDLSAGWRLATSRLPSIFGYAMIMATIGMVLRFIVRPAGILGRLLGPTVERWLIFVFAGLAWHTVPYFVVPIIVSGERNPLHALRRSAGLIKDRWGDDVVVNASVWLIFAVPLIVVGISAAPVMSWAVGTLNEWVITGAVFALLMMVLLTLIFKMAMDGIFSAAAFEFATSDLVVKNFHEEDLRSAFGNRPSRIANGFRRAGRVIHGVGTLPFRRRTDDSSAAELGADGKYMAMLEDEMPLASADDGSRDTPDLVTEEERRAKESPANTSLTSSDNAASD